MLEPSTPPGMAATLVAWTQAMALTAYSLAQFLVLVYASHRYALLWRWWRPAARDRRVTTSGATADLPVVTVQLPVFNESRVVERLIDAAAALDYPRERLEIQVLDDSDDETSERAAAAVARHRARGLDVHHLQRRERDGFKAGALAAGLARARGSLLAVFDADFVPPADFLRRLVPRFGDPAVGMVQARWGHLNRRRSVLTAAQAAMLDAHFLVEHRARMQADLFFNFNGTAGIWRRGCIEDSGGWSNDTLTEDLDLSYRAQLRGWRFVFEDQLEAPAELPGDMEALKSQQRRWTKGSIQTARKLLPRLWRSRLPMRVKLEAVFHLTSNVAYPLVLALGLLLLPVLLAPNSLPAAAVWTIQATVLLLGLVPVCLFLAVGRRLAGGGVLQVTRDVPSALLLGVGLSLNNTRAVLEGLGAERGDWQRTPKTGDEQDRPAGAPRYASAHRPAGRSELALAAWFVIVSIVAWQAGHHVALPFTILLATGLGWVGVASVLASHPSRRLGGGAPARQRDEPRSLATPSSAATAWDRERQAWLAPPRPGAR